MSDFYTLASIADDIEKVLTDSKYFKEVRQSTLTSYEQLYELLPDLALMLPAAVICLGSVTFENNQAIREIKPGIIIVDQFRGSVEKRTDSIWALVDKTGALFMPEDPQDGPVVINNVIYTVESFDPIPLKSSEHAAYAIGLQADNSR